MKKTIRKELIEWVIFISVIGGLYLTGLHTEVIGTIQRVFLSSGILQPDINSNEGEEIDLNYHLVDAEDNLINLKEYEGKTLFINYWATWCPPCIAEMPDINDLYLKTNEDVKFIMISVDDDQKKAIEFLNKKEFDFPLYFETSARPEAFYSQSIPTTIVVSPEGRMVVKNKGMAKYDTETFREFLRGL